LGGEGQFHLTFNNGEESLGVKFKDADLLGLPIQVTISPRTLQSNSVEIKKRTEKESELVPLEGVATRLKELIRD